MKKKMIAFSFIAWAIIALSNPGTVKASVYISGISGLNDVIEIVPTQANKYLYGPEADVYCENLGYYITFSQLQLFAIPGFGKIWAPVDYLYHSSGVQEVIRDPYFECKDGDTTYYRYD